MTDLRTAAKAVLDACDKCVLRKEQIEALRQALATPVEPVAYMIYKHGELYTTKCANSYRPKGGVYTETPLYTTPPSVDALIGEIDGLYRNGDGLYIYADKLDEVLDKYRGQK